jgi:hypothetical protein
VFKLVAIQRTRYEEQVSQEAIRLDLLYLW